MESTPKYIAPRITALLIFNYIEKRDKYRAGKIDKALAAQKQRTDGVAGNVLSLANIMEKVISDIAALMTKVDHLIVSMDKLSTRNKPPSNPPTEDFYKKAVGHSGSQPSRPPPSMP